MNRLHKQIAALVIIALIIIVGVFSYKQENKQHAGEIEIGLIGILSGPFASIGESMTNGAILASEQWNAEHPDLKTRLIVEDDGFDAKKGLSAYNKLMDVDKVAGLVNISSPTINIIYPLVTERDIPVSQFGEQDIAAVNDNIFQIQGSLPLQKKAGEYLRDNMQGKKIAVAAVNESTFIRFADAIDEGYGSKITRFISPLDTKDMRSTAAKIMAEKPDVVVLSTSYEIGALLVKELSSYPDHPQFFFDTIYNHDEYVKILGDANMLNGSLVAGLKMEVSDEFKQAYKERFGEEPGQFADYGYDGFKALMLAYDEDPREWIENMNDTDFEGAGGRITYDETGTRISEVKISEIQNGVMVAQ
jgi:branched-chain amino acid transport system substrate-binding protein